jgi:hypothetical protein
VKVRYLPGHAWLAVPDHRQNLLDELNIDPENPGESVIFATISSTKTFPQANPLPSPFGTAFALSAHLSPNSTPSARLP